MCEDSASVVGRKVKVKSFTLVISARAIAVLSILRLSSWITSSCANVSVIVGRELFEVKVPVPSLLPGADSVGF